MKITTKLSPIAIAVAALCISPLALAGATVTNSQNSALNVQGSIYNSNTDSILSGNAAAGASGNIGVNIATGSQNQQGNAGACPLIAILLIPQLRMPWSTPVNLS
jgi:hypothetical protein